MFSIFNCANLAGKRSPAAGPSTNSVHLYVRESNCAYFTFSSTPKNTETFTFGADQIITVTHDGEKKVVRQMRGLMHEMELRCFDPTQAEALLSQAEECNS